MLLRDLFLALVSEGNLRPYQGGECIGVSENDEEIYVSSPIPVGMEDGQTVFQYELTNSDGAIMGVAFPVQRDGDSDNPSTGSFDGFRVKEVLSGPNAIKAAAMLVTFGRSPSLQGDGSVSFRPSFDGRYELVAIEISVFDVWTYGPHLIGKAEVTTSAWIANLAEVAAKYGIHQSDQLADWRAAV